MPDGVAGCPRIGFITDVEGNLDFFQRAVNASKIVQFTQGTTCFELEFKRKDYEDVFVFGGDYCDKGDGDIRIARSLVEFKKQQPYRVHLLLGNRDLNKIRVSAELRQSSIDVPDPVPLYPGMRESQTTTYRSYLLRLQQQQGAATLDEMNTLPNRLRWLLDITLGAEGQFESRREELRALQMDSSDDGVVQSYIDAVESEDGHAWQYLWHGEALFRWGDTLFAHSGVPAGSPGWIPPLALPYATPDDGNACPGEYLPAGHTLDEWIAALNQRCRESMLEYRSDPSFMEGKRRRGELLLSMQSQPSSYKRSVVVLSPLVMGMPQEVPEEVTQYLLQRGVRRVVAGHKPCGDSPFVVHANGLELIMSDTTYSDHTALDKRGRALASVEVAYDGQSSCAILHGSLRDGVSYCFRLPPQGPKSAKLWTYMGDVLEDPYVGQKCADGWWVKAVLSREDGCHYHCAFAEEGDRHVRYKRIPKTELEAAFAASAAATQLGKAY
mmetsp:Transcript_41456/g.75110  ORF Transcript_41456/g.75110 Transcript_41456/m.75110 type:complete len:497 (+) Transcript_41456:21-1511(+)